MIINSILDTDLYKFLTQQLMFHQFPTATATYKFKCRDKGIYLSDLKGQIENQIIESLSPLHITNDEISYMRRLRCFKEDYLRYLRNFRFDVKNCVKVSVNGEGIDIIIKGKAVDIMLFEIPILAIVNETYHRNSKKKPNFEIARDRLWNKLEFALKNNIQWSEFGTRRRYSREWQDEVVATIRDFYEINNVKDQFFGTSNVYLAMKYNLKPIGTQPHELFMLHQQVASELKRFQIETLENWVKEYDFTRHNKCELGLFAALTDTVGTDAFLRDFVSSKIITDNFLAARQDSGDPFEWVDKVADVLTGAKYSDRRSHILLIFSDSLTMEKANEIKEYCAKHEFGRYLHPIFGIGTDITCDISNNIKKLNIVIKMVECNEKPVAKVSDSPGKIMCEDEKFIETIKETFEIKG